MFQEYQRKGVGVTLHWTPEGPCDSHSCNSSPSLPCPPSDPGCAYSLAFPGFPFSQRDRKSSVSVQTHCTQLRQLVPPSLFLCNLSRGRFLPPMFHFSLVQVLRQVFFTKSVFNEGSCSSFWANCAISDSFLWYDLLLPISLALTGWTSNSHCGGIQSPCSNPIGIIMRIIYQRVYIYIYVYIRTLYSVHTLYNLCTYTR